MADHPHPADPDLERGRAVRLRANGDTMAACFAWIAVTFDGSARERFLAAKERRRQFRVVR